LYHSVEHVWFPISVVVGQQLYNSKSNSKYHLEVISRLQDFSISDRGSYFSVYDVINVINLQKCNKAAGPDGIHMETYIYGGYRLNVCLSLLFEMFLCCGYVPQAFTRSPIIPLIKCKSGDLSDVNNYRAICS